MNDQITISVWLFAVMLVVTIWAILDRLFIPSIRWFLRRRINRVLDEIGSRLSIEIRPFQLTKRQVLIDRLVYDSKVMEAIRAWSEKEGAPMEAARGKVLRYAREIVPAFNAYIYFRIGYWIAKRAARLLYRVRVGLFADREYASIDTDSTVVFVMNHRSNMDYILTAFLAAERTTLSYAVGEWARIWPLHTLIRAMGAYFVRRNSGNALYRVVLERYIHMATREGVCQAMFPEGGLSRDGLLRPPKYGLMDYMLRGFDPRRDRDIVFIPVGINYDRTLEDRSLLRALNPDAEKRSMWFVFKTSFSFMWRSVVLITLSRWRRFGYACVNFGPHVSAREFCEKRGLRPDVVDRETRFAEVKSLTREIMDRIAAVVPVLPASIVAAVMLDAPEEGLSAFDVEARANDLIAQLEARDAPVYTAFRSRAQILLMALTMLKTRRLLRESEGLFTVDPDHVDVLRYYANSIEHWRDA